MIGKKINQLATELAPVSTDLTIIGDPISGVSKKITLAQLGAIFSGAVSFYTNLAGFPATGDINVIYCAKDTQKLYLWNGSAYTEVFPSQALLDTYQLRSEKGVSNGYASLDSGGKVPISQLPSSIMEYKGTWSASTNTPTLANGTGDTGDVYICNSPGSVNFGAGAITFAIGDYVIYSGTIWQRSSGAVGTVTSVGLSTNGNSITIGSSPVTTSGTISANFVGNSTQYINGAGNLVTFPGVINEAQNLITEVYNKTGATLTKGTVVYINGGQGNLPSITKALATGDSTSAQTYGIVRNDITNNNNGYVVVAGRISDLDTQAYTEGTQLYLSPTTAGTYTSTKPYAPNHLVYVGIVVRAHPTQGVIEVKIQNGYEMDELHNVAAQTPSNNDGLFWEASTSLWKNKSIATVLGYTPQAQLNGTGFVKASGTTISYDNSTYVTTDTFQTISASKTFSVGLSLASAGGTNQLTSFINTSSLFSGSSGSNVLGFNSANNIYFGKGLDNGGVIQWNNSAVRYYTLPDATGTIALVGGSGVGTVTSVGLSSATSGVTIGSTPITTSGTITLAIATASGSQQGLLSSTDWTTFNNKQNALTNPVTGTGTTNYLPKFTGTSTIGNSIIFDDGSGIRIGAITHALASNRRLTVVGASAIEAVATGTGGEPTIEMWQKHTAGDNVFAYFFTEAAATTRGYLQYDRSGNRLNLVGSGNGLLFTGAATFSSSIRANAPSTIYGATNQDAIQTIFTLGGQNASAQAKELYFRLTAGGTPAWTLQTAAVGTDTNINIFPNGNNGLTIAYGTGAATFSSSVTASQLFTGADNFTAQNGGWFFNGNGSYATGIFAYSSSNNLRIIAPTQVEFYTNLSERMRITSGGNVGIGTTSPSTKFVVSNAGAGGIELQGSGSVSGGAFLQTYNRSTNAFFDFDIVADNMIFRTGQSYAERLRITSGGRVGIGTTDIDAKLKVYSDSETNLLLSTVSKSSVNIVAQKQGVGYTDLDIDANIIKLFTNNNERLRIFASGNVRFSSQVYGNTVASPRTLYIASDGELGGISSIKASKTNINILNSNWLMQLNPVSFNYRKKDKDGNYTNDFYEELFYGLIAEETELVNKEICTYTNNKLVGIEYSKLVPVLVKAVQELKAELDTLKNK